MILENSHIRLEFDKKTGSIANITDKKTKKEYLNDPGHSRLCKLIVPTPEHVSRPLYSHEAGTPVFKKTDDTLFMTFPRLLDQGKPTGIALHVTVRLPADSPEAFFSLQIQNDGEHRIHELWFPWLGGRSGHPGQSSDTITTSKCTEPDIYDKLHRSGRNTHTFGHHHMRMAYDPIHLLPMMDMSDQTGGLSYNKYEKRPSPHILVFENPNIKREPVCLTWSWVTGVFVESGQTWTSCEYGVGVHQHDWHATADRFRAWLSTWYKPCDTPARVKEKIGLFHIHAHGFSGERHHEFQEMPSTFKDAQKYGIHDLMIWDNTASIYYRPDQGDFWEMPKARSEELKKANSNIKAMGGSVSAYVNWRLLSKRNRTWPELKHLAQKSLFGVDGIGFQAGTMDGGWYGDPGYEMGSSAVCCGADHYEDYANRVLDRTFSLGFNVIAVDQAGEWNYCLSPDHGHTSPWEAWKKTYEWFGKVTKKTRDLDPNAYTIAEVPDLYNTQYIDLWWIWMWKDIANPAVFRYILPNMIPVWCIDENQRQSVAEAFAFGSFLAVATKDMTGRLSDDFALAKQIARLAVLRKQTASFVAHGCFVHDRGLHVENGQGFVYLSSEGIAVVLANGRANDETFTVTLDLDCFEHVKPLKRLLFMEGVSGQPIKPEGMQNKESYKITLPAYQACVLTLQNADKAHGNKGKGQ